MTALTVRELCHRWVDEVWHPGKVDLVASCVAPMYTRHEPAGTRIVTPTSYGEESWRPPGGPLNGDVV